MIGLPSVSLVYYQFTTGLADVGRAIMLARGAVDVIAVMQKDGNIKSSPFHIKLRREGNFLQEVCECMKTDYSQL